jgi:hypothetical protein
MIAASREETDEPDAARPPWAEPLTAKLRGAERLPIGDGYRIRRPNRAFGAPHAVEHLRDIIDRPCAHPTHTS